MTILFHGAGLDVIEGEELLVEENIFNSPIEKAAKLIVNSKILLDNENVVITPHNAFNSIEAVNRIINTTIENIINLTCTPHNKNENLKIKDF